MDQDQDFWSSIGVVPATPAPQQGRAPYTPPVASANDISEFDPDKKKRLYPGQPGYEPPKTEDFLPKKQNPISNFLAHAWSQIDPTPILKSFAETGGDPVAFASKITHDVMSASVDQFEKARAAYKDGRISEALGHLGGTFPVVGPMAAKVGEDAGAGDISGALGDIAGLVAVPAAMKGAKAVAASDTMAGLANVADASATRRLTRVMSPPGASQANVRLANRAADAAPTIAREPGAMAVTRTGLLDKIIPKLDQAAEALNTRYAELPVDGVPTKPIRNALVEKLNEFVRRGSKDIPVDVLDLPESTKTPMAYRLGGDTAPEPEFTIEGTPTKPRVSEFGLGDTTSFVPAAHTSRVTALRQAISEIDALGDRANPEEMRKLAAGWGSLAKTEFAPATAPDFLRVRGEGRGWADAEGVLRSSLNDRFPGLKTDNTRYSLLRSAHDAMQAAEEADQVRQTPMNTHARRGMESIAGTAVGAAIGGAPAVVIGALVGPIVDSALTGGVTLQIGVARALARFSDAVKAGQAAKAESAILGAANTAGVKMGKPMTAILQDYLKTLKERGLGDDTGAVGPFKPKGFTIQSADPELHWSEEEGLAPQYQATVFKTRKEALSMRDDIEATSDDPRRWKVVPYFEDQRPKR